MARRLPTVLMRGEQLAGHDCSVLHEGRQVALHSVHAVAQYGYAAMQLGPVAHIRYSNAPREAVSDTTDGQGGR